MNRFKQKSTWLGVSTILMAVIGFFAGTVDSVSIGPMIASGLGLVAVDA